MFGVFAADSESVIWRFDYLSFVSLHHKRAAWVVSLPGSHAPHGNPIPAYVFLDFL